MSTVTLKGYNAVEFSFANKLPHGTQIKLGNKYQFNVKYAPNNSCVGEMSVNVYDRDHEDKFFVKLVLSFLVPKMNCSMERTHAQLYCQALCHPIL